MRTADLSLRGFGRLGLWYASCGAAALVVVILAASVMQLIFGGRNAEELSERFLVLALVVIPLFLSAATAAWLRYFPRADYKETTKEKDVRADRDVSPRLPPAELVSTVYKIRMAASEYSAATKRYAAVLRLYNRLDPNAPTIEISLNEADEIVSAVYDRLTEADRELAEALKAVDKDKLPTVRMRLSRHIAAKRRVLERLPQESPSALATPATPAEK
jgi:hypothetical protein